MFNNVSKVETIGKQKEMVAKARRMVVKVQFILFMDGEYCIDGIFILEKSQIYIYNLKQYLTPTRFPRNVEYISFTNWKCKMCLYDEHWTMNIEPIVIST